MPANREKHLHFDNNKEAYIAGAIAFADIQASKLGLTAQGRYAMMQAASNLARERWANVYGTDTN